jgi:hypothetical protein
MSAENQRFAEWANRWMVLARYEGPVVPDVSHRIGELIRLWREEIPGSWQEVLTRSYYEDAIDEVTLPRPIPGSTQSNTRFCTGISNALSVTGASCSME